MKRKDGSSSSSSPEDSAPALTEDEIAERRFHATRCAWAYANGHHCLMPGERSRDGEVSGSAGADGRVRGPQMYCSWHHGFVGKTNFAHSPQAFMDWLGEHRKMFPTSIYGHSAWTRYDMDTTWSAVLGEERYPTGGSRAYQPPLPRAKVVEALRSFNSLIDGKKA